jgi:hypothetical protein
VHLLQKRPVLFVPRRGPDRQDAVGGDAETIKYDPQMTQMTQILKLKFSITLIGEIRVISG